MAIVVEDGTGKSDAEAYVAVSEVTTYHSVRRNPTSISGASIAAVEAALREVTAYLDGKYFNSWPGEKRTREQTLSWPRLNAENEGWYVESTIVPQEVKDASAELVERSLAGNLLVDVAAGAGNKSGANIKVGPIEVMDFFAGVAATQKSFPFVEAILAPLLTSNQLRLVKG